MRSPLLLLGVLISAAACGRAIDSAVAGIVSEPETEVKAGHGAAPMASDPTMLMTHLRSRRPGDSVRAESLANVMRRELRKYRDHNVAIAAGYRAFPPNPGPEIRIVHYTNNRYARRERTRVDPARPGSLLYERMSDGSLRLVGAMLTAPVDASLEELDARVPLSMTQWHLHQNICVPKPVWDKEQWQRRGSQNRPLFGPGGTQNTRESCEAVGGRFLPTVFGWMAHIHVFAENPADTWNAMYGHGRAHGHDRHH